MHYFLFVFFLIYGSFQYYFYWRLKAVVALTKMASVLIGLFLLLQTFAPAIVRITEHFDYISLSKLVSFAGFYWMGFVFEFVCLGLLLDAVLRCARFVLGTSKTVSVKQRFTIPFMLAVGIVIYGGFEAERITINEVRYQTNKVFEGEELRVVQISDLHLGIAMSEKKLQRIVSLIQEAEPDIVIATGDIVDGQGANIAHFAAPFRELTPCFGKYAVTGNHEFYAGITSSETFLTAAGFEVLRNRAVTTGGIILAGVDDRTGVYFEGEPNPPEATLLGQQEKTRLVLLAKHQPRIDKASVGFFDLQISGHTHKGQFFPFNLLTWLRFPVPAGRLVTYDGVQIYVSRGVGTWGPPIRFLAPPEVTLFRIVAAQ